MYCLLRAPSAMQPLSLSIFLNFRNYIHTSIPRSPARLFLVLRTSHETSYPRGAGLYRQVAKSLSATILFHYMYTSQTSRQPCETIHIRVIVNYNEPKVGTRGDARNAKEDYVGSRERMIKQNYCRCSFFRRTVGRRFAFIVRQFYRYLRCCRCRFRY